MRGVRGNICVYSTKDKAETYKNRHITCYKNKEIDVVEYTKIPAKHVVVSETYLTHILEQNQMYAHIFVDVMRGLPIPSPVDPADLKHYRDRAEKIAQRIKEGEI